MLDNEEINKIEKCVTGEKFMENKYSLEDKDNKIIRVVWRHPGTDVTGIVSRSEKIVSSCEKLLDGEVYHYHAKLIMKEPEVSGPIYWHQDYGYWYHYGNLFPDLLTVWVAVDSSTIENGCLEVLAGSNKCGRLDHHVDDGQNQVAELSRLESIKERCPHVKAEMEKGDVLFLHSNTLHYSSPNRSKMRRIGFLMCYNKASNESVMKHHHAQYTPIQKVPDSAIKESTKKNHEYDHYYLWYEKDERMSKLSYIGRYVEKGAKKAPRIIWSHPGTDVTGMAARCEKVVNTCEKLLGGEVYHYHSKYMLKDPNMAAPHYWHQDYGYWYKCGNLFPDMMTVWVALDKAVKQNGCMEILSGSHKCGRIEHHPFDGQYVGLKSRVDLIRERCPHHYMEMNPGDALFFHCNTIHHSSANKSDLRRWAYIMTYNRASNNPTMVHHHPQYTPLEKVANSAIKECTNYTDLSGKDFIHPLKNTTLTELYQR
ncbi:Hypothetical predicted protein [Mytilus galloprovincialis]|uniref:Uncharacterized protein n=1 Tax=Mytilus galloprovincialis TaxID=29158 RepID=A0A8B6H4Z2_MYTGA|nr:Hypothetical predicted protein [Mytilus galloprovincialis]